MDDLKKYLDEMAARFETTSFIANDPCKYDFALFGIGESQKHVIL